MKLFTYLLRCFFLGLALTNFTNGILYATVTLTKQLRSIGFCFRNYFATLLLKFLDFLLIAGNRLLHILFTLMNSLAFSLPIALITHNVLKILVALNVVTAHDFRSFSNDIFGQSYFPRNLNGKRTSRSSDGQLKEGTHLMAVVEHGTIGYSRMRIGEMLQVLIVGRDDSPRTFTAEFIQDTLCNGTSNLGFRTCSKLIYQY